MDYNGFTLVYSRRNSLVERIERWGDYESATIDAIAREVAASGSLSLVDIGANIGLVSLAVLAAVPGSRVFAFEPGPHQHDLLAQTISVNDLGDRLELSDVALSDQAGTARFAVHASRHAAGDGLLDTGRSGKARLVDVRTDTLDRWWEEKGRPEVAVVKIDTEGSELLILRGARRLLEATRPVLFLELHEDNLRVYPYGAEDVERELDDLGYRVERLGRAEIVARPA